MRRAGIEPVRTATGGGSDVNALMVNGVDCVLLANGTVGPHTPDECVATRHLDDDARGLRGNPRRGRRGRPA